MARNKKKIDEEKHFCVTKENVKSTPMEWERERERGGIQMRTESNKI